MDIPNSVHPFILIQIMASSCNILSGVFGNMPYEWDDAKRRETLETRGIDFAEIYGFDWGASMNWVSNRHGEERQVNLGMIGDRLYHVVWVWRGEDRRIISLRKANEREERVYYGD